MRKLLSRLSAKDQEHFELRLKESQDVLKLIQEVLEIEKQAVIKESRKKDNYFMPAWSEYQASRLGSQETYDKIIQLLEINDG